MAPCCLRLSSSSMSLSRLRRPLWSRPFDRGWFVVSYRTFGGISGADGTSLWFGNDMYGFVGSHKSWSLIALLFSFASLSPTLLSTVGSLFAGWGSGCVRFAAWVFTRWLWFCLRLRPDLPRVALRCILLTFSSLSLIQWMTHSPTITFPDWFSQASKSLGSVPVASAMSEWYTLFLRRALTICRATPCSHTGNSNSPLSKRSTSSQSTSLKVIPQCLLFKVVTHLMGHIWRSFHMVYEYQNNQTDWRSNLKLKIVEDFNVCCKCPCLFRRSPFCIILKIIKHERIFQCPYLKK